LPIFIEREDTYLMKLKQVINTIVEIDLAYIASYTSGTAIKVNLIHPFPSNVQIVGKYSVNCIQMIKTFSYGNK